LFPFIKETLKGWKFLSNEEQHEIINTDNICVHQAISLPTDTSRRNNASS